MLVVMICHEVQEALPDANALIVRKNYEAMDSVVLDFHVNVHYSHKRNGLVLVNYAVTSSMTRQ